MTPYEKAIHHESAGEYGRAVELLRQCLSARCHDEGEVLFHIGWCLEQDPKGDRAAAVSSYEQAAAKASAILMRINAFFRAGWVLMQDRAHDRAEVALKKAIDCAERASLDHELHHNVLFWHAVCLEHKGKYLDAMDNHARVQRLSALLAPESLYREIVCNNQVGRFEESLALCRAYPAQAPAHFDLRRFAELYELVKKEEALLVRCLNEDPVMGRRV